MGGYFLYIDNYPNQQFYVGHFSHLEKNIDLKWFSERDYQLPEKDVRHGSILPITSSEAQQLRQFME